MSQESATALVRLLFGLLDIFQMCSGGLGGVIITEMRATIAFAFEDLRCC